MQQFRSLPKVDVLANDPLLAEFSELVRVNSARRAIQRVRDSMETSFAIDPTRTVELAVDIANSFVNPNLQRVINMSGVILHTGLGRARLADEALQAIQSASQGHAAVEFDLPSGERGDRQTHVRDLLCLLTGAEDALVVNNAAAALVLALRALAFEKDVLLSRGQMVEIGGSFRVPNIVKESGCKLVEVGCTNKTHLSDYEITAETGAILVCHRSNFEIVGFASEPSISELVQLGLPVVDDMGTGCIVDVSRFGLPKMKTLTDSVREGAHVTIGSGDKLLGGPQAGIILGKRDIIARIRQHSLARAVRVDKLTLAALRATLVLYAKDLPERIPTIRYLVRPIEEVRGLAEMMAKGIKGKSTISESHCEIGGGSGPGTEIPSFRVGLETENPAKLSKLLRISQPGVIGRIEKGVVWLDPRTAEENEVQEAIEVVNRCLN